MRAWEAVAAFRRREGFDVGRKETAARPLRPAGWGARWRLPLGGFELDVPIPDSVEHTLRLHDLHHIATGYSTDLAGEIQIAAWELAGGCGRHVSAWVVNLGCVALGLIVCPRRMGRAFRRGEGVLNLFRDREVPQTVGDLRARLGRVRGWAP